MPSWGMNVRGHDIRRDTAGRPQRAMALLGLALALGFAVRLPLLMTSAGATLIALRGSAVVPGLPAQPPVLLAAGGGPMLLPALAGAPDAAGPPPSGQPPVTGPKMASVAMASTVPSTAYSMPAQATASLPEPATSTNSASDLATRAYASLAAGDRRGAARLFDAAIAAGPDARAHQWQRERTRLGRRWSGDAYALFRVGGNAGPVASPVLGGGQTGSSLAWTLDPLARRPLAMVGRVNAANDDPLSTQAAIGLRWKPIRGVSVSAERLLAIGMTARNDWTLRLAAGAQGRRGVAEWSSYGEAGVLGNGDVYGGGQARALLPLAHIGRINLHAGPGMWASIQTGGIVTDRVDVGPSFVARAPLGSMALELSADWRFRAAGNAEPGSGPAVTISTQF